jgi:hypothetical protein
MNHEELTKLIGKIYGQHVQMPPVQMKRLKDFVKQVENSAQERFATYLDAKHEHEAASLLRGLNG